ncbi:unnamed protein product [Danaus chrysippus]|uniref:(African queen) hypothetical protein n=1 Tax=Danaus chrysippus TaxID=151541 RepID=A0A8J2VSY9_9NEOP|nr:unnamed protein product [Danaus chrysippus]
MSGSKCRPPTTRAGSIIILGHICSGLDLLEKAPTPDPPDPPYTNNINHFLNSQAADTTALVSLAMITITIYP